MRRLSGDRGAAAAEHALLLAAIAAVLVVVLFYLGTVVAQVFQGSCESVKNEAAPASTC